MQAVLINQGWECKGAKGKAAVSRLGKVPMTQLCPSGFIFIWVDKTLVRAAAQPEPSSAAVYTFRSFHACAC